MIAQRTYLVEVLPITKFSGLPLNYFSSQKIAPGTFVQIPLKRGRALGIVDRSIGAASAKAEIRRAAFALRKIAQRDVLEASLTAEMLEAAKKCAEYYGASPGSLLQALLPKTVQQNPKKFFPPASRKKTVSPHRETLLLQMETDERYGQYRGLVREAFARKKSVLFVVPTQMDLEKAKRLLSQGIEQFVYDKNSWPEALTDPHSVLFVTTPGGLCFDRPDLDLIIFERENSRAYRTIARPHMHWKTFAEYLSRISGKQLVLGDSVFSIEALWREKEGEFGESSLIRWRLPGAPAKLVDSRSKPDENGKFEIFSPELKELIGKAVEEKEKIFLFGARKGLAPSTVCGDCGTLLPCENCGAPAVLHRDRSGGNIYVCHACGTKRDSSTSCGYCGSWKLVPLGIGTEKIAAEARRLFPRVPVEILDKDHAPTESRAKSIIKKFEIRGGILIGTELAFFHVEKVAYSGLVSVDSLFSVPDFGINERIFYLVSRLREMTQKEGVIQTRNIGKQVLAWAAHGNIIDFYQNEISERREMLYPPFSVFIKVTSPAINSVLDRFLKWQPESYKDSIIIRLGRDDWPNPDLSRELSLLGPQFLVKVDPESIL